MKALTLQQPWATLIAIGAKKIETRSWSTTFRGPLAIHAAKEFPKDAQELCFYSPFRDFLRKYVRLGEIYLGRHQFPLGCVIATCELVRMKKIGTVNYPYPDEPELSFGDYTPGRYAWYFQNIIMLPEPIPAKGSLGLWEWEGGQP